MSEQARLTDSDIYYLRSILANLKEVKEAMANLSALGLGNEALADNIDWLDCFIVNREKVWTKDGVRSNLMRAGDFGHGSFSELNEVMGFFGIG